MPLSIKNPEAEQLAHLVVQKTGETITKAVIVALQERLERLSGAKSGPDIYRAIDEISKRCASLPDYDMRPFDEILGYNESGHFE